MAIDAIEKSCGNKHVQAEYSDTQEHRQMGFMLVLDLGGGLLGDQTCAQCS